MACLRFVFCGIMNQTKLKGVHTMSTFVKILLKLVCFAVGAYVLAIILGGLISYQTVTFSLEVMTDGMTLLVFALLMLAFFVYILNEAMKGKNILAGTKKDDPSKTKQFFDSKFLSTKDLEKITTYSLYTNLKSAKDGILVRSELKGSNLHINLRSPIHTMVIGTTGVGKTTMFVDPFLQIMPKTKTQPSVIITDPKGELYANHAHNFKKCGYNVKVLNLRDVFSSTRWNPMGRAYDIYQRALHIEDEIITHNEPIEKNTKLSLTSDISQYQEEWYEFNGVAYSDKPLLMNDVMSYKKILISDAQEDLKDIAMTLVPVENQNDPSWEMGAQSFAQAVLYAMLEDSANPELGMTKDKFTFYNFGKIAFYRDLDPDDQFATLKKYLTEGRDKFSEVPQLANTVVGAAPNTARSYVSVLSTKLGLLSDMGICYTTSADEMEFEKFDEKPTAFFIIIPDEKQTRHGIATLCVVQLYKTLIELANKNGDRQLKRNTYFMMDEFGNLPKISLLDKIITVGRSRKIFMILVVQSYTQLNNVYGDKVADIVRTNCNIQVFLGTTDQRTKEEFSKMCGNITVKTTSKTKGEKDSKSESTSETSRPLIYPEELELLPKNTAVVKIFKENPAKVVMTPCYQCKKFFDMTPMSIGYAPSQTLDEAKIFYDIEARNKTVLKTTRNPFDDFDF